MIPSALLRSTCKSYIIEDATYIWSQWEPHMRPPPSHLLAQANLARESILTMLQAVYTTPNAVSRNTQALIDLVYVTISVEICILFTTVTLREEEMVTNTPSHLHPAFGLLAFISLTNGAFVAVLALLGLPTRQRAMDPIRPNDPPEQPTLY